MDPQDLETPGIVRAIDGHLTIEATWAHECCVEYVRSVGGSNDDDAGVPLKTIHLSQELVEGLFAFVITTAKAGTTLASNRIDLVDKDDARSILFRLFEQVAHAACTNANEHFDKF